MSGVTSHTPTLDLAGGPSLRSNIKDKTVTVRLSSEELTELKATARATGLTASGYTRAVALGQSIEVKPPVPAVNAQVYAALGKVGGNLNQIAARLNVGDKPGDIGAALVQLTQLLKATRAQLLGAGG